MTNRFNIGDTLWTFDMHYEDFIQIKVESIKKIDGQVYYNGMYLDEDCAKHLSEAKQKWIDFTTSVYQQNIKSIMEKYYKKVEVLKNA